MEESFKYQGIMKDFDLSIINQELIESLLGKEVYAISDEPSIKSEVSLFYHERWGDQLSEEDREEEEARQGLCGSIHFKGNCYVIKNEIIDEIYSLIEYYSTLWDYSSLCRFLEKKASLFLTDLERIEFFKEEYKRAVSLIDDEYRFSIFLENQYEWKKCVYNSLKDDNDLIEEHLSNKIVSLSPVSENDFSIIKQWQTFKQAKEILECCQRNLNLLSNSNHESKFKKEMQFTRLQKVVLFEKLMGLSPGAWENLSATKKGEILEILIDRNGNNIKKDYLSFEKMPSDKLKSDQNLVEDFLKSKLNNLG